jgi:hypothetical protein
MPGFAGGGGDAGTGLLVSWWPGRVLFVLHCFVLLACLLACFAYCLLHSL